MSFEKLVNENLKLVHLCCHKMKDKGVDYDELYSAGCLGLVKAAKRFDKDKGFQFSTYAVPVILGEIKQIFRDNNPVKISRSLKELALKINREIEAKQKQNETISISEIAEKFGCSVEDVVFALNSNNFVSSLESDDGVANKIAVLEAIEKLDFEDKQIVNLRFFKDKTQSQTAKILGLNQVQVSRKEKNILKTLKNHLYY